MSRPSTRCGSQLRRVWWSFSSNGAMAPGLPHLLPLARCPAMLSRCRARTTPHPPQRACMTGGVEKSMPMLPWWPGAFMTSTRGWSVTARGVYRELLDAQWDMGTLPAEPADLRRIIGATEVEWAEGWTRCASKFIPVEGGLQNPRLEEHRADSLRRRSARVAAADRTNAGRRAKRDGDRRSDRGGDRTGILQPEAGEQDCKNDGERAQTVAVTGTPTPTATPTATSISPEKGDSFGISRPLERTAAVSAVAKPKPPYMSREFHDQVIAAYHEHLPGLPAVKVWSAQRIGALNARIAERRKDGKPADTIEYWQAFFRSVAESDFLCGRSIGASDFRADLEWLLRPENFTKVIEGRYESRRALQVAARGR